MQRLSASRFKDKADFLQARIEQGAMAGLDQEIGRYRIELEQARGAVVSLEETLKGETVPDIAALENHSRQANEELEAVESEFLEIDRRCSRIRDIEI